MFYLYDVVRLKEDDKLNGVKSTYIGAVVDVHTDSKGEAYTVEFIDEQNETIEKALFTEYKPDELVLVERYKQ